MLDFNASPYFDDYKEFKDFVRILFRPGFAVQAREATQLQTILQEQITRLGNYNFEDGSRVFGGETSVDPDFFYVKLDSSDRTASYINSLIGSKVIVAEGVSSGVKGIVKKTLESDGSDPFTLYVKYENSGNNNTTKAFQNSEALAIKVYDVTDYEAGNSPNETFNATVQDTDATGKASAVSITDGIRFVLGFFLRVEGQTVILSKYDNTPTARIGLRIKEAIVTEKDDPSLLDNALGSPNEAAPGAHRYRIRLELAVADSDDEEDFIEILRLKDGKIEQDYRDAQISKGGIGDELAKRTYDQSGNFTAEEFVIDIQEDDSDDTLLTAFLDNGRAYVSGFEVTTTGKEFVSIEKGRDTGSINNSLLGIDYDSYVVLDEATIPSGQNQYPEEIATLDTLNITDGIGGTVYATARARAYAYNNEDHPVLYLFDIQLQGNGPLSSMTTPAITSDAADGLQAEIVEQNGQVVVGRENGILIAEFPVDKVATIQDISYSVRKNVQGVVGATETGKVYFTTTGQFDTIANDNYVVYWDNGTELEAHPIEEFIATGEFTNTLVLDSDITSLPTDGTTIYLHATVRKNTPPAPKSKVRQSYSIGPVSPAQTHNINKADIIDVTVVDSDGVDVTDRYLLDNGQRDGYYGLGKITLKSGQALPSSNITISGDYYEHVGSSDYFTVDSYPDADYNEIGSYISSFGEEFDLRSCIDFRPKKDNTGANFTGAGSSYLDTVAPGTLITGDISFYLPRIDKISVDETGNFYVIKGSPANDPVPPKDSDSGMTLFEVRVPAYTFSAEDVEVEYVEHKRFTMRDIGKLENRIENIEYYTALSLLEKDAADRKVVDDQTGLERFKNGFLVDSFTGHGTGGVENDEYNCSIDTAKGQLRAPFNARNVDISLQSGSNYQITGDVITLPYTEVALVDQPLASKSVSVNPYAIYSWEGDIKLSPESDTWVETRVRPVVVTNRDGQFNNIRGRSIRQGLAIGGIWNFWQDFWTGRPNSVRNQLTSGRFGVRSVNVPRNVQRVVNERTVSIGVVPFIRQRKIDFTATRMKPFTRVYPFFDGEDVSDYVTPSVLTTDANGKVEGRFSIPDPTDNSNPRFRTGERIFRLIDSSVNDENNSFTIAEGVYAAQGTLRTRERTIVSVRRPRWIGNRFSIGRRLAVGSWASNAITGRVTWSDPLAQSFLVRDAGGVFLTSIDLYFAQKDSSIPVTVQIREMVNGYPGQKIVPFSEVTLNPDEVQVSEDGSLATNFKFEAPVHLQEDNEYCFVVLSNSNLYHAYVGRMGEPVIGNEQQYISKQPYAGVLFKSQNASTWSAEQEEDLKFRINKAQFDTSGGEIVFENESVETDILQSAPLLIESGDVSTGQTTVTVSHPNHGFVGGTSKVTIAGFSGTIGPITASDINTTHTVTSVIDRDNYTITILKGSDDGTITPGRYGSDTMTATPDAIMDVMQPVIGEMIVPGAGTRWYVDTTFAQSTTGDNPVSQYTQSNEYVEVDVGDNVQFDKSRIIASEINEQEQTSIVGNSLKVKAELTSSNANLSPVIDLQRTAVLAISNRVSDSTPIATEDTDPDVDGLVAKYVTKNISLEDPAVGARVILNANRRQGAEIDVYIKRVSAESDDVLDGEDWVKMTRSQYPSANSNVDDVSEYEFTHEEAGTNEFDLFAIKIVMYTSNPASVPIIEDFRAIALGT